MAKTNDVVISISRATKRLQEAGFGLPLLLGEGGVYSRLDIGSGEAGLRWIAKTRGTVYINVLYQAPAAQVPTAGKHSWGFTGAKAGADASGLANDATTYTCTVAVDGGAPQAVSIVGSAAQTMAQVCTEIAADLTGATCAFDEVNDLITATSLTTGDASSVRIVDTDLFSSLTDANATAEIPVDGTDDVTDLAVVRTGSGTSGDPYIITVTLDTDETDTLVTTAKELKTAAEANADVAAIVQVLLIGSTGSGTLAAAASAPLAEPSDRYTTYNEPSDVTFDGYSEGDDIYDMVYNMLLQSPSPATIAAYSRDTGAAINTTLDAIRLSHDDWYALLINNRTKAEIIIAAAYVEANKKIGVFCCSDETLLDDLTEDRAVPIIHDAPSDYPDCAIAGRCLPANPGSITWKWKKLSGQTAQSFTSTKLNAIAATLKGNWLEEFGGYVIFKEGVTAGQEYIDVIRGQDWVEYRMTQAIMNLLISSEKIALDNEGIPQIESKVREVLSEAAANGIIAVAETEEEKGKSDDNKYMFTVTAPLRSELSEVDRTNRNLSGIEWEYTLAGAVHKVDPINGRIVA